MKSSRFALISATALVAALSQGCAAPVPPRVVRLADVGQGGPLLPGQALIVEVQEGDTIPLVFSLHGPFVTTPEDAPPIPLRARRRFFLRIDKDGLRASADGQHFDAKPVKPGSFQFGLGASKEGVRATIKIETPVPVDAIR